MAAKRSVNIEISATDKASLVMKQVSKEADNLKSRLAGVGTGLGGLMGGAGFGALGGAVGGGLAFDAGIRSAGQFEYALYQTTKVTTEATDAIARRMQELPAYLGSATELTQGYYQVMSAGVTDAAASMATLETASKLAAVAETTQGDSIRALTKMMAGYRGEIKNVSDASDLLLDIEQFGQATVKELIPVIGDLSGVSQQAGVSYKEMAAGLSLLTQTAGSPAQAATQFRALEMALLNSNDSLEKIFKSLKVKNWRELVDKNGLAGGLHLINEAARKSNLELAKVYGSSEAFTAAMSLGAGHFKAYSDILAQVGTQAGRTDESFQKFRATFQGVEREATSAFSNVMTMVGNEFLPAVKGALGEFSQWVQNNADGIKDFGREAGEKFSAVVDTSTKFVGLLNGLPDGVLEYGIVGMLIGGKKLGMVLAGLQGAAVGLEKLHGIYAKWGIDGTTTFESGIGWEQPMQMATPRRGTSISAPPLATDRRGTSVMGGSYDETAWRNQRQTSSTPTKRTALPTLGADYKPVSSSGKGSGKADAAARYLQEVNIEIEKMLGTSERFDLKLDKKLEDIGKKAKEAGLPLSAITDITERFSAAANEERLRNLGKAVGDVDMAIANMTGDTQTARALELNQRVDEMRRKFEELGLPVDQANAKIQQFAKAWEKQSDLKDLQTAASFYKDLAEKSGQFGLGMEYQNRLIEEQVKLWIAAKIPMQDIVEMKRLLQLEMARDPLSGLTRGLNKYVGDATNAAAQTEQIFTTAFQGIGDIGGTAMEEIFERGNFAADRFFLNLGKQIAMQTMKAATNQIAGGIFGLLGQGLSAMLPIGTRHTGGMVDGSGPYKMADSSMFVGAARFHSGGYPGLRPDEIPLIALRGERVLNRDEARAYEAGARSVSLPRLPMLPMPAVPIARPAASPQVVNNFTILPPSGYEAREERRPNNQGGEDITVMFDKMMAKNAATYGSHTNKALRTQGSRQPVMRMGG